MKVKAVKVITSFPLQNSIPLEVIRNGIQITREKLINENKTHDFLTVLFPLY